MAELRIDDRQARMAKGERGVDHVSGIVGPAVMQQRQLPADNRLNQRAVVCAADLSDDAAHLDSLFR